MDKILKYINELVVKAGYKRGRFPKHLRYRGLLRSRFCYLLPSLKFLFVLLFLVLFLGNIYYSKEVSTYMPEKCLWGFYSGGSLTVSVLPEAKVSQELLNLNYFCKNNSFVEFTRKTVTSEIFIPEESTIYTEPDLVYSEVSLLFFLFPFAIAVYGLIVLVQGLLYFFTD